MLEKFSQSSGNILGYKILGKITKEDYETLEEDIEGLVQQEDDIRLLLELDSYAGELVKVGGAKLKFRSEYRRFIPKMAIVGDKKWEAFLTSFIDPFYYDRESKFFSTDESQAAWEWLKT